VKFRAAAQDLGIRAVLSPRASIYGARIISSDAGIGVEWLDKMLLRKGLDDTAWSKLTEKVATL